MDNAHLLQALLSSLQCNRISTGDGWVDSRRAEEVVPASGQGRHCWGGSPSLAPLTVGLTGEHVSGWKRKDKMQTEVPVPPETGEETLEDGAGREEVGEHCGVTDWLRV